MKSYNITINGKKYTITANSCEEANKIAWRMWYRWSGERLRELSGLPGSNSGPAFSYAVNHADIPYFYTEKV